MKVPNASSHGVENALSLSRLQNEGSQPASVDATDGNKSIKATE